MANDFTSDSTTAADTSSELFESASTSAPETVPDPSATVNNSDSSDVERDMPLGTAEDVWNSDTESEDAATVETETPAEKPADEKSADDKSADEKDDASLIDDIFNEKEESETEKPDEKQYTDEQLLDSQRNKFARDWAERNAKKAETVKRFQFNDTPIDVVATELAELAPERYKDLERHLAHKLVDENPSATFARAYVVEKLKADPEWDWQKAQENGEIPTLEQLIKGELVKQEANSAPDAVQTTGDDELDALARDLTDELDFDWRDPANEDFFTSEQIKMVRMIKSLEQKALADKSQAAEKDARFNEISAKLEKIENGFQSVEQTRFEEELTSNIKSFREPIENQILSNIAKHHRLEVTAADTPEIKAYKESLMLQYRGTDFERANGYPSQFEFFAENESSVKKELETVIGRVIGAKTEETKARLKGDTATAAKYKQLASDEVTSLGLLYHQANTEFMKLHIAPVMKALDSASRSLSKHNTDSSKRIEIAGLGAPQNRPLQQQKVFETAEDVWNS